MAELVLGRCAQRGAVGVFSTLSKNSCWKMAGWIGVTASFLIMSYYSVIAGWGLNYILLSLNQFYEGKTAEEINQTFQVLSSSGDITLFWHLAFTALAVGVVYPGVRHGVEYWSKIMTTGLLGLLFILCIFSFSLEGFWDAFRFIFYPDFSEFSPSSALEALGLAFFTLSLGQGIMITYGSYMRRTEDIPKTGGVIGGMIIIVSLMAALMIFPIIFTFGFTPQAGPGLVFKTLPLLFAKLPGALLLSTAFFVLFVFTALTSSIALVEVVAANFMDLLEWPRKKAVIVVGVSAFIFGIPSALSNTDTLFANWPEIYGQTFFETVDGLVSVWLLPIDGLLIALFTGWVFNSESCKSELLAGTNLHWVWGPWMFFMRWIAPVAILMILLQKTGVIDVDRFFENK